MANIVVRLLAAMLRPVIVEAPGERDLTSPSNSASLSKISSRSAFDPRDIGSPHGSCVLTATTIGEVRPAVTATAMAAAVGRHLPTGVVP